MLISTRHVRHKVHYHSPLPPSLSGGAPLASSFAGSCFHTGSDCTMQETHQQRQWQKRGSRRMFISTNNAFVCAWENFWH